MVLNMEALPAAICAWGHSKNRRHNSALWVAGDREMEAL